MFDNDKINHLEDITSKALLEKAPDILINYPTNSYIDQLLISSPNYAYKYINTAASKIHGSLKAKYSEESYNLYHKLVFIRLIKRTNSLIREHDYPTEIIEQYEKHFEKILKRLEQKNSIERWFDYALDKFWKDFGILRMDMIPAGAMLLHKERISLQFLIRGGVKQFIHGCYCILFVTKGFRSVYAMHMNQIDPILMSNFNPQGWEKMFQNIALLLEKKKKIKAIVGTSWFFDPKIPSVSPEISFCQKTLIEIGALFFKQRNQPDTIRDAVFMNNNRKTLLSQGKYNPQDYLAIIPRNAIINWGKEMSKV